jgi:hypothetical protein
MRTASVTKWRWTQSLANPSLDEFPLSGKIGEFSLSSGHHGSVSPLMTACCALSGISGSISNRQLKRAYQGVFYGSNPYMGFPCRAENLLKNHRAPASIIGCFFRPRLYCPLASRGRMATSRQEDPPRLPSSPLMPEARHNLTASWYLKPPTVVNPK